MKRKIEYKKKIEYEMASENKLQADDRETNVGGGSFSG